jgi:hypothetical protein
VVLVVCSASLVACSGGGKPQSKSTITDAGVATTTTQQSRAEAACRASLDRGVFVSAQATKLGAVRKTTIGTSAPSGGVLAHEFEPAPDDSFAAWCWRRVGDEYQSYVVGPTGQADTVVSGQNYAPAPGAPVVP